MKMTPLLLIFGGMLVFWGSTAINIFIPAATIDDKPSEQWRAMTDAEREGLEEYKSNGCSYCHSRYVRTMDWDIGAERISEKGDYHDEQPAILGTERTGPDLSQEGGEHPADWHLAHFSNPRYTRPLSLMPSWEFLGQRKIDALTAYMQGLGGKHADGRLAYQEKMHQEAFAAWKRGPDANIEWLHANVPEPWRAMPNPYPALPADLSRGKLIYQQYCMGCHGEMGDGNGPAAKYLKPTPVNFTLLRRHLVQGKYIGGILYYQIMNGVTGSAMPYFKKELESEKIWDVSNRIGVDFIGYTDGGIEPRGIRASYEPNPPWKNPTSAPAAKETTHESK